jgi:CheY-like chemotaxis protein
MRATNQPEPAALIAELPARRWLVAEDNPVNQAVITQMLKRLGQQCTIAGNGVEAVEKFGQREFDIVLLDLQMPLMDGFEAARLIRELINKQVRLPASVRLIALSADDPRTDGRTIHFDEVLLKPVRREDLVNALEGCRDSDAQKVAPGLTKSTSLPGPLPPAFDYEYALNAAGGIREQFSALAALFLEHTPNLFSQLDDALKSRNFSRAALHSHSLQGSAAAIGGLGLHLSACNLTKALRAQADWHEIDALRSALDGRWNELIQLIAEATAFTGTG